MFVAIALVFAFRASASDHIDGPVTTSHRVADLTDLFAFPTPNRPGFLSVILNAYPLVPRDGHFSDKVNYTILVRASSIRQAAGRASFVNGEEVVIDCTFATPEDTANHLVRCATTKGMSAVSGYQVVQDRRAGGDFRIYAGMRADPFFFNADFATDALEGKLNPPDDSNVMKGVNILAIVMEINLKRLFASPPSMIAVAAQTTTRDSPKGPLRRLDRVGRPEITNVSMAPRNEPDLRDRYNLDRPFQVPVPTQQRYEEKLARNIAFYDKLDGHQDWRDPDRADLAKLLAFDFLVIDMTKGCRAQSFFEIERAILRRKPHETCGGRKPDDDIMDTLFTTFVTGLNGRPVRDGVDSPDARVSGSFPYLAAPDLGFWSMVKAVVARKILGIPDSP